MTPKNILILIMSAFLLNNNAFAESGSASGSCSGTATGLGYFYAYTYQYAYLYNGEVSSESHSFSFSGFLESFEDAEILGASGRHIIYSNGRDQLAVPYVSGAGLYVLRNGVGGPDSGSSGGWTRLCDY